MKRQHPLHSTFGISLTIILLIGLGITITRNGGRAFSPGNLSAKRRPGIRLQGFESHVDFESDCSRCHAPLDTTQDMLCTKCHTEINAQRQASTGTHALIDNVNQCAHCHSDHQGREFNPTHDAFEFFDHAQTHFSLTWHLVTYDATPMQCTACHYLEPDFNTSIGNCAFCHADENLEFMLQHVQDFGENCLVCHDGQDRIVDFDHQSTAFPLDGAHLQLSCKDCHQINQQARSSKTPPSSPGTQPIAQTLLGHTTGDPFKNTSSVCIACHLEPQIHQGAFSSNCADCHSTDGWLPANLSGQLFDHASQTGFSLVRHQQDFSGQALSCHTCHADALEVFDMQSCLNCHTSRAENLAFMQAHLDQYGSACLDCHDGMDRMANFNHEQVFPLDGRHAEIVCEACHVDKVFLGIPSECVQCHAEPRLHAGFFGVQCQNCHTTLAWTPAYLQTHVFPLDHGGRGEIDCQTCHLERYIEYTCYGCHDHQPVPIAESHERAGIMAGELPFCTKCHPNGFIQ